MQPKKVKNSIKKKDAEPISFSNPNSLKDIPDNPDVKVNPNRILFGDFIKKGNANL
tara:strand:- start:309 stop:476 length:168 start_codon:yes stop_codon:yes gene_type:complete